MADKRARTADRKGDIINHAIDLIVEHGLAGTTMSKIAIKVGVTEPALYRHFKNRKDIMEAALDRAGERLITGFTIEEENVPKYIRNISLLTYQTLTAHPKEARLVLEFICAPSSEDLGENVINNLLMTLDFFQNLLDEGIRQETVRPDIDRELIAWELFSLGFTLAFVASMGLHTILSEDKALRAVDDLIERIRKR